jgi:hypothetical protein
MHDVVLGERLAATFLVEPPVSQINMHAPAVHYSSSWLSLVIGFGDLDDY